jgi:hypothetical protein
VLRRHCSSGRVAERGTSTGTRSRQIHRWRDSPRGSPSLANRYLCVPHQGGAWQLLRHRAGRP